MSDLIVDFPRRQVSGGNGHRNTVSINETVDVRFFERVPKELWYSNEEHNRMCAANARAIRRCQRMVTSLALNEFELGSDSSNTANTADDVTGLERFLSPDMIGKIKASKQRCTHAVLHEQDRQVKTGDYDPAKLAQVSIRCSQWSRKRARIIGKMQSM